jgi:hypothetical protein
MRRTLHVQSQAEGDALVRALDEPVLRAAVVIGGVLAPLSMEERRAVLAFVLATNTTPATPTALRLHDAGTRANSSGE